LEPSASPIASINGVLMAGAAAATPTTVRRSYDGYVDRAQVDPGSSPMPTTTEVPGKPPSS
jgi:hypothetical protein